MRILTAALICGTFLNAHAMNHDMEVVDILLNVAKIALKEYDALSLEYSREKEDLYEKQISSLYADAKKTFRDNNTSSKTLTMKELRNSTYKFLHHHDLGEVFDKIAIFEIEVPHVDQPLPFKQYTHQDAIMNLDEKNIQCVKEDNGQYLISTYGCDHSTRIDLFHNEKYNDIIIGSSKTNFNEAEYGCSSISTSINENSSWSVIDKPNIYISNVLEAYECHFIDISGSFYLHMKYNDFFKKNIKFMEIDKKNEILCHSEYMLRSAFRFRYICEKQHLTKEYIFPIMCDGLIPIYFEQTAKLPYYFSNLALSLANQPDKKLVDIADQAINAIKNGVIINDGEDIRTEFTCDSNASPDEYGIDSNGVVRFNAEKNKAAVRDLLTRMGYDPDAVFERIDALTK